MKKLVLTSVCGLAMAGAAFAQGNVNWTGPSAANFTAQTNAAVFSVFSAANAGQSNTVAGSSTAVGNTSASSLNGTTTVGGGFYYTLLFLSSGGVQAAKPTTISGLQAWTDTGLMATNGSVAGRAAVNATGNAGAQVPWSPGTSDSIIIAGWSGNMGTTFAAALAEIVAGSYGANSFFGLSNTGLITPDSTSTSPGASLFGTSANANGTPIQSLLTQLNLLAPVPEPATMALAGLGGLSLLALRRKK